MSSIEALEKYGRHFDYCLFSSAPCTCGFDAAIKAAQTYPGGKGEQRRQLDEPSAISDERIHKALDIAFLLGQQYWQQADSESYKQNKLTAGTQEKFDTLVAETRALLAAAQEGK